MQQVQHIYTLPTKGQGKTVIERVRRELVLRVREGGVLSPEEIDWLDWADLTVNQNS